MGNFRVLFLAFLMLTICVGCDRNVHVTGRVTFENGQPLTIGQIIFTDDFYMGKSDLDKNGEYSLHTYSRNDGVKKGIYRVYITGACRFEETEEVRLETREDVLNFRAPEIKPIWLVDLQHTNPDTSGWVFDIQKSMRIDFVVYPPNEVPEDKRTEEAKYFFEPGYRKKIDEERAREAKENGTFEPLKKRRTVNPNLL